MYRTIYYKHGLHALQYIPVIVFEQRKKALTSLAEKHCSPYKNHLRVVTGRL